MRQGANKAIGLLLVLMASLFYSNLAYAVADGGALGFGCVGGSATGNLYNSGGSCPTTLQINNLFSFLICNLEQLSSNIMGQMYCGMISELAPAVWAVATLAILFFGISFAIGLTPATGREALLFVIKIVFVTGFATNADLLIGTAYSLLITGMKDGVGIVLSGIGGGVGTGNDAYAVLDDFLLQAFRMATDNVGAVVNADRCKNAVFAVIGVMLVIFPLLAYLALLLIARMALTFLRAVLGYLYALIGITFLMVLAPFFLSFFFFKQTRSFFDKWVAYLVSFSLQVVLLFAAIAFILSIEAKSLADNLPKIIMYDEASIETTAFRFPWSGCTLCEFKVVDKNDPTKELTDKSPNLIEDGQLQCRDTPPKPIDPSSAMSPEALTGTLSPLILLAGEVVFALIALVVLVEQLLSMVPSLAHRFASGLGASYAPAMGAISSPLDALTRDFNSGFREGFGGPLSGNSVTKTAQGIRDGMSVMVTGRTADGREIKDAGIGASISRFLSDPNRFN